jgi:ATP diphosphatase
MAEEAGVFDFEAVAAAIVAKLEARHPHIFGDTTSDVGSQPRRWEEHKARERAARGALSAMDGVAQALPALVRAEKLQQRAARDGFDWPDTSGPTEKLAEEIAELAAARDSAAQAEEAGDLLFAAVNLVRRHGVAPEEALRAANIKFERRYRSMEALAVEGGLAFGSMTLADQEALWQAVKAGERTSAV